MTDREMTDAAARAWVDGYLTAWASNDEADIRALFAPDAEYRYHPWDEPVHGADAIVAAWLDGRDEAGSYTFEWNVVGVDGDRAFVQGVTAYTPGSRGEGRTYSNLWVLDLSPDGRARSFTEWYMTQPATATA